MADTPEHPAKFSTSLMNRVDQIVATEALRLDRALTIVDPFAGVGTFHRLGEVTHSFGRHRTIGVEIEPEWATVRRPVIVADAQRLPIATNTVDVIVTSPCYGNRMADHHEAKDRCKSCRGTGRVPLVGLISNPDRTSGERWCPDCGGSGLSARNTYRHKLGRALHPENAGAMQWGPAYRRLHERVILECLRVCRPGGLVVWNVSNHIRDDVEQLVAEWHVNTWLQWRCAIVHIDRVGTPRQRQGANAHLRVDGELIAVFRIPTPRSKETRP